MQLPRAMMFVDGENLVMRYQDSLAKGREPREGVIHEQDCFVWHPDLTMKFFINCVRVTYYTSVVGDEPKVLEVKNQISKINYECTPNPTRAGSIGLTGHIVPVVFKKPAKSQKTRSVDIRIVIDVMRHAFSGTIDLVYLASGDGDYIPLITEIMRHGTQVYVGAFSSGLSHEIPYSVDDFFDLDPIFFVDAKTAKSAAEAPKQVRS